MSDDLENINEPLEIYSNRNQVHIFSSFDAAKEDEYRYLASLSGEEHLQNATRLIEAIYDKELKHPPAIPRKIVFLKP